MPVSNLTRWQLSSTRSKVLRRYDNECVIYDAVTGDSHLLHGLSSAIVTNLFEGQCSVDEMFSGILAGAGSLGQQGSLKEALEDALLQLERRGLITCCPESDNTIPVQRAHAVS